MTFPHFGSPHPDEIVVPGIMAILYDPQTGLFGVLRDRTQPQDLSFVTWGKDPDEHSLACLLREIREETGYGDIADIIGLCPLLYSHYYHPRKRGYFAGQVRPYLVIMRSLVQDGHAPESHEADFVPVWVSAEEIVQSLESTGAQRYGEQGYQHRLMTLSWAQDVVREMGR